MTVADELTLKMFADQLGSPFVVSVNPELELELVEAEPLGTHVGTPRQDPFRLLFRGPAHVYLPQTLYQLTHESLGPLELFLIPRQPDEAGSYFEVIVN